MQLASYNKWVALISQAQSIWDIAHIQTKLKAYSASPELKALQALLDAKKASVNKDATTGIAVKNPTKTTRPGF